MKVNYQFHHPQSQKVRCYKMLKKFLMISSNNNIIIIKFQKNHKNYYKNITKKNNLFKIQHQKDWRHYKNHNCNNNTIINYKIK
jgi:RIO-like serine/threonine protein kinase